MSRLIDSEKIDFVSYQGIPNGYKDSFDSGVLYAMNLIYEQPTIYAVPVVRCYECKHSYRLGGTKILYQCDHNGVRPNYWFCADGEKVTE